MLKSIKPTKIVESFILKQIKEYDEKNQPIVLKPPTAMSLQEKLDICEILGVPLD